MANWAAAIGNIFTGGAVKSIENIALEWIDTDLESAQATTLKLKVLDPNGKMRRDIMTFICRCYGGYLILTIPMIFMSFFGFGEPATTHAAMEAIKVTFAPITGLFTVLATASFGVNATNTVKGV